MQTVQQSALSTVEYHTVFKEKPITTDISLPGPPLTYKLYRSDAELSYQPRLDKLTDSELIDRCRSEDRAAFNVLIKRHELRIFNRAYRLAGNAEDAHDIAAVTRLRIFQYIDRFRDAITLHAWINRIVTNVFIDSARSARRYTHASLETLYEHSNYSPAFIDCKLSHCPHALVEERERDGILTEAVNALPENLGVTLSLFYFKGRSYEEIAELLNIPIGTVKSRLNRARILLKERLSSALP